MCLQLGPALGPIEPQTKSPGPLSQATSWRPPPPSGLSARQQPERTSGQPAPVPPALSPPTPCAPSRPKRGEGRCQPRCPPGCRPGSRGPGPAPPPLGGRLIRSGGFCESQPGSAARHLAHAPPAPRKAALFRAVSGCGARVDPGALVPRRGRAPPTPGRRRGRGGRGANGEVQGRGSA